MAELTTGERLALAVRAQVAAVRADRSMDRRDEDGWGALWQEAVEEMRALAAAWGEEGGTLLEWVGVDRDAYMRAVGDALAEDA
jgi:hypothetical protein